MSDPFASAAELSQFIKIEEPADLARMQLLLDLASGEIRRYTGQTLSQVAGDVVVLLPEERTTLILPERPVTAITTVVANGITLSSTTEYYFDGKPGLLHSGTVSVEGTTWTYGATVTYDHGYAETTDEYKFLKKVCLEAASNAYTLNERGASEALGGTVMESAGWAPAIFLTPSQKMDLMDLGKVGVG